MKEKQRNERAREKKVREREAREEQVGNKRSKGSWKTIPKLRPKSVAERLPLKKYVV